MNKILSFFITLFIFIYPINSIASSTKSIEPSKIVAEKVNGLAAMIGLFAAIGSYMTTGQIIPGIF